MLQLEVCIDSFHSASNAFAGGADRLEVCSSLLLGGLSPSCGLLTTLSKEFSIPLFCMIRPRHGNFIYSADELKMMKNEIVELKKLGATGFVFGILDNNGFVDVQHCRELLELASPLPCTFHRAFDCTAKWEESLEDIINLGFSRILTSGRAESAFEGRDLIKLLVDKVQDRIIVVPGAGINSGNLEILVQTTNAQEYHASASIAVKNSAVGAGVSVGPLDGNDVRETSLKKVSELSKILKCLSVVK